MAQIEKAENFFEKIESLWQYEQLLTGARRFPIAPRLHNYKRACLRVPTNTAIPIMRVSIVEKSLLFSFLCSCGN